MRATHAPYSNIACRRAPRVIEDEFKPKAVSSRHFQYLLRIRNFEDNANRERAKIERRMSRRERRTDQWMDIVP